MKYKSLFWFTMQTFDASTLSNKLKHKIHCNFESIEDFRKVKWESCNKVARVSFKLFSQWDWHLRPLQRNQYTLSNRINKKFSAMC